MKNFFVIGLVLFLIILRSLGVLWGVNIYFTEKNSQNWPSTIAVVKESKVIGPIGKKQDTYSPEWTYEYFVNSKKYISKRTAFGVHKGFNNKSKAELELSRHPVSSEVKVIYNPENPSHAALELSSSGSLYWMLIFAGVLCIFAGVMILTVLIKSNKNVANT